MQKNKHAFTLVELLVVVLIIGVLSAIAIPMYQGAVDKSHWSTILPGAKAIKDAEEAIKMTNGSYTDEMANLDITMNNSDLTFNLVTPNNTADPNVIRVTNSKLNNVRLASYLDDNPKFAGQLHCEALKNDERANRLCGKLLMGQELTEQDGYTAYLLDQEIDKATCNHVSRSWSTSKTKCYKDDTARCTALGMGVQSAGQCGYTDSNGKIITAEGLCHSATGRYTCGYSTIEEGGRCLVDGGADGCFRVTVKEGGVCEVNVATRESGCTQSTIQGGSILCNHGSVNCGNGSTVTDGGSCSVNWPGANCYKVNFKNNSICYANAQPCDLATYDDTSCCCGKYCDSTAPKCDASRCDPQYMK